MLATVLAPLVMAVVLITSGIAKLQDPEGTAEAFVELRVPVWARTSFIIKVFPLIEVALGVALLVMPSWGGVLVALAALGLFVAFLVLIGNALRRGGAADCNCFGGLTSGKVTKQTLWRNIALVVVAVGALIDIIVHRTPALWRLFSDFRSMGWVVGAALTALVTALIVREDSPTEPADEELLDYVRQPIPFGVLKRPNGEVVPLVELPRERGVVLVMASPSCGACSDTVESLPRWRDRLPKLDILLAGNRPALLERWPDQAEWIYHDEDRLVGRVFGGGVPMCVLIGADGWLAGGPVWGTIAINDLLGEVEGQLAEFTGAPGEHSP